MSISHDRKNKKLWWLLNMYIDKVLQNFNVDKIKLVSSPLAEHIKFSSKQRATSKDEKDKMKQVFYASPMESLMYVMICVRPYIAHADRLLAISCAI